MKFKKIFLWTLIILALILVISLLWSGVGIHKCYQLRTEGFGYYCNKNFDLGIVDTKLNLKTGELIGKEMKYLGIYQRSHCSLWSGCSINTDPWKTFYENKEVIAARSKYCTLQKFFIEPPGGSNEEQKKYYETLNLQKYKDTFELKCYFYETPGIPHVYLYEKSELIENNIPFPSNDTEMINISF